MVTQQRSLSAVPSVACQAGNWQPGTPVRVWNPASTASGGGCCWVAEGFAVGVGRFVRLRRLRPLALDHALPSLEQGSSSARLPAGCTALPWALAPSATGGSTSHPAWATTTHFSGPQLHVWRPPHCPVGVREVPARPLRCCVAAAGLLGGRWGAGASSSSCSNSHPAPRANERLPPPSVLAVPNSYSSRRLISIHPRSFVSLP